MNTKNIRSVNKFFLFLYIKLNIILKFVHLVFKKELAIKEFSLFMKKIFTFLKICKDNKVVKIGDKIKLDINMPYFGSELFYKYLERFLITDEKIPCSNVLLSVTKDCSFECKHCYQREDHGEDIDIEKLLDVTDILIEQGITLFRVEGGDPFNQFDRLKMVCEKIGGKGEIIINSTGNGITLERMKDLSSVCNVGAVMFSLNSPNRDDVDFFMGQDYAWNTIIHGIKLCNISDVPTGLNCCLQRDDFFNGNFEFLLSTAQELNISYINILHPKSAGAWIQGGFRPFTKDDIDHIKYIVKNFNKKRIHKDYAPVYAQVMEEDSEKHGCTAGGTDRFYINAKGDVQPCEYLNISFGNINSEDFKDIYKRMREEFETPGTNWLCETNSSKISSMFKENDSLPLNTEKSKMIYNIWDRGEYTPLYKKIEKELI